MAKAKGQVGGLGAMASLDAVEYGNYGTMELWMDGMTYTMQSYNNNPHHGSR